MTVEGFKPMPTAQLSYDGLRYGGQYPQQTDIEFECKYIAPDEIEVAGKRLSPRQAKAIYEFLTSDKGEEGPIGGLVLRVQWFPDDYSSEMPWGVIEEVTTWLEYVLGIKDWDGSYDSWEF